MKLILKDGTEIILDLAEVEVIETDDSSEDRTLKYIFETDHADVFNVSIVVPAGADPISMDPPEELNS